MSSFLNKIKNAIFPSATAEIVKYYDEYQYSQTHFQSHRQLFFLQREVRVEDWIGKRLGWTYRYF